MSIYRAEPGQIEQLLKILQVAAGLPGYKERFNQAGLESIGMLNSLKREYLQSHFLRLGVLYRHEVRKAPSRFLNKPCNLAYSGMTSGTRSERYVYFADAEWNRVRLACRSKALNMWGITGNMPIINVASRLHYAGPRDITLVGPIDSAMCETLRRLLEKEPSVIRGYPSRLSQLADIWPKKSPLPGKIKCVICTGECLYDFQVQLLEDTFQVPVVNEYGCHEAGISGISCPEYGNIHVDTERALFETVNDRLVVTDLYNSIMPMVRYCCGDIVTLDFHPCPCDRPGPIIKVHGRQEDRIRTLKGMTYAGAVQMPALEGISSYRIERLKKDNVLVSAFLKEQSPREESRALNGLEVLILKQFGPCNLNVLWLNPAPHPAHPEHPAHPAPTPHPTSEGEPGENAIDRWYGHITGEPWSQELFTAPLPDGPLRPVVETFRETIAPTLFSSGFTGHPGDPQGDEFLLRKMPDSNATAAICAARISAFAATRLFYSENPGGSEISLQRVQERLSQAIRRSREEGQPGPAENAATDLAILETLTAPALGVNLASSQSYRECRPLDFLSIHHLLKVLEICWLNGRKKEGNRIYKKLNPLSCLLIGDLNFFLQRFGDWLLYSWQELLGFAPPADPGCISQDNEFIKAWVRLRHLFAIHGNENNRESAASAALEALAHSAKGKNEKKRVMIESAYLDILQGRSPDTAKWKQTLLRHLGKPKASLKSIHIDSFPLVPIMKALALPLHEAGEHSLSYQCLGSIFTPSSTMSSLERISQDFNAKQFVLSDLGHLGLERERDHTLIPAQSNTEMHK